jgi:ABC-type branched-subunit amino acid transport system substrate-binding protein
MGWKRASWACTVALLVEALVVGSGVTPAGAQSGRPGVNSTTINVGGMAGVTNPTGVPQASGFDGIQAYFNYINGKGGVFGRKFKLVAKLDDQSRASQDVIEARSLVEEVKVFAVAPVVTEIFAGASYLASKGVPTFGWDINAEWATGYPTPGKFAGTFGPQGAPNLFGEKGSYLCLDCPQFAPPFLAQQVGARNVAIFAYTAPQSAQCAQGMQAGFQKYGFNVVVYDPSLPFGFTDLGSDIDTARSKNVQFVGTCMDIGGEVNVARSLRRAGLNNVKFYAPQGYDPTTLKKYGTELNGIFFFAEFVPFEDTKDSPALATFEKQMNKLHKTINEQALVGWINGDLLYKGIKKAGPNFTQQSVVRAINSFNGYTADGIRPPINWSFDGHGPGHEGCAAYVEAVNGKFVPRFGRPGQPFVCAPQFPQPNTLDPAAIYYRPAKPGETLPPTATVPSTVPPQP